jgi:hypothetical protein
MKTRILSILIAIMLAVTSAVFAQKDDFKISGSIGVGGLGMDEDTRDAAKLNEYRDLSDGPFGVFDMRGRSDRFYLDAFGENLDRDDMYINMQGGIYGQLKFRAYGDWLAHNFGFGPDGARTPYENPGSTDLGLFSSDPAELSNANVPPWASFHYSTHRRNVGGSFEYSRRSPWYILIDANQVQQDGINKVDLLICHIQSITGRTTHWSRPDIKPNMVICRSIGCIAVLEMRIHF